MTMDRLKQEAAKQGLTAHQWTSGFPRTVKIDLGIDWADEDSEYTYHGSLEESRVRPDRLRGEAASTRRNPNSPE